MVDFCRRHVNYGIGNGDWSDERHELHISSERNELCRHGKLLDGIFCCGTCNVSECPDECVGNEWKCSGGTDVVCSGIKWRCY